MSEQELLNDIGQLVDKAENYMAMQKMGLPPQMAVEGLVQGLTEIRDELRNIYEKAGGNCDETWTLGPYK